MYWPGHSCNLVNGGSPLSEVIRRAIYLGHIQVADVVAQIYLKALKSFIYIPDAETILVIENELRKCHSVTKLEYL